MKSLILIFALAAGALMSPGAAQACAVCGLDGDPGYFWSLLFLMGMPFAIVGTVGGVFLYNSWGGSRGNEFPPVRHRARTNEESTS